METQIMDSEEGTTFSGLLGGLFWGVADPVSKVDTTLDGSTPEHGSTPF